MSLQSKYPGRCYVCGGRVNAGDLIDWDKETHKISHEHCTPEEKRFKPRRPFTGSRRNEDDAPASRSASSSPLANPIRASTNITIGGAGPRIGIVAFNKHIAAEMQSKLAEGKEFFTGSPEQDAIWNAMLNSESHLVINASAGAGKSSTAQQGVLRMIKQKDASARAMTYHSLGLSILRRVYGKVTIDEYKLDGLVEKLSVTDKGDKSDDDWYAHTNLAVQMVRLCKHYLDDGTDPARLAILADYHNVDYDERIEQAAFALVPKLLALDKGDPQNVDFDDMTWLPVVLNLKSELFDVLIIDEAQDTDRTQQALAKLACPNGRIFATGDKFQGIYGFRGADTAAMGRIQTMLTEDSRGCASLPLTVTRRCPKKHVQLAQSVVGDGVIYAMEDAREGTYEQLPENKAIAQMRPGDLVLCRVNRFLVPVAYDLIQRGIKAVIRGRDIGAGLEALIRKLGTPSTTLALTDALNEFHFKELARLQRKKNNEHRIGALNDRCGTLHELMSGTNYTSEVIAKIQEIFADFEADGAPKHAVILGTVHRVKGLESDRVFILAPDLIPHPMAIKDWEIEQEYNLAYVAVTRSKDHIVFVGSIPKVYDADDSITKSDLYDEHDYAAKEE